ncbi:MAG: oligosaccharide flippase family protein [Bacteroidetes bacterium]|nr:oligosaccharide flippase family protein [Bacteroidota bacterium]MBS1932166.1 oligosaccharide flippase family protein [Bacteroidota bacterium]
MEWRKHIVRNFIARVCYLSSTFLLNIFFSRLLGASGSGDLFYVINNFSIITLIAGASLESGMTYFLAKKEIGENELVSTSFIWSLVAGILSATVIFFYYDRFFPSSDYIRLSYSIFFIAGNLLTTYFSGLFFAKKEFLLPQLIPAIVNMAILVFCVILAMENGGSSISWIVGIYFAGFIISGILMGVLFHIRFSLQFLGQRISFHSFKKLARYSSFALITNIVAFLAYRIDYWILNSFPSSTITEDALGNYIQVSKLVQLFLFVPTVIATIVFPASASASGDESGFNHSFKKMARQVLLLNAIACIVLIIAGNGLFVFIYGRSFSLMYSCFLFSIPAILSITIVRIVASYFAGTNRIRYNFFGSLIALFIITALNFLLIPLMGINGSALADSAGYLAYMIFLLSVLKYKG